MPGFGFSIAISDNLPLEYRNHCFVRGPGNPIMLTNRLEETLLNDGRSMLSRIERGKTGGGV
jgi:hypothetical protein